MTEAHLWLADPEAVPADRLAILASLLDAAEQARAARFRFDVHRRQFVVAHALARRALEHHGGHPPAAWRFAFNRHGCPRVAGPDPGLVFNISHTDGLVACLVGRDAEVGVDVEHTDRGGRLVDVAERFFSAAEAAALREMAAAEQPRRFLDYWTLKEAYIKARGLGLALPLGQFTFLLDDRERVGVRFDPALDDDPARWRFTLKPHGTRHVVATATAPVAAGRPMPVIHHDGAALLG